MKKTAKWIVIGIFIALMAWGIYRQQADAAELRLGLGRGVSNGNEWVGQELAIAHRHWYGSVSRLGGDDLLPDTVRLAAGYRADWRTEQRLAPYLRLGGAYFTEEPTDLISDRWAYDMALGLRIFGVLDLEYQHNSTAGRSLQNSGNDMLLLGLVVRWP